MTQSTNCWASSRKSRSINNLKWAKLSWVFSKSKGSAMSSLPPRRCHPFRSSLRRSPPTLSHLIRLKIKNAQKARHSHYRQLSIPKLESKPSRFHQFLSQSNLPNQSPNFFLPLRQPSWSVTQWNQHLRNFQWLRCQSLALSTVLDRKKQK